MHSEGQHGGTKRSPEHGAKRASREGHFLVRARQLTPQARGRTRIKRAYLENAKRVLRVFFASFNTHMSGSVVFSKKSHSALVIYPRHPPNWNRYIYGSVLGLVGGIVAPLIGSILTVISWMVGPAWYKFGLHRAGTVLLVLGIPLLTIGAHCMDLSEMEARLPKNTKAKGIL